MARISLDSTALWFAVVAWVTAILYFPVTAVSVPEDGRGAPVALAGTAVQPGFYYHEPSGTDLELSEMKSGVVCTPDEGAREGVCEAAIKIPIIGQQSCEYSPGTNYPCTRFGYEFDYSGAASGNAINCTVTRQDPMGRREAAEYRHDLDATDGRIAWSTFRTYAPVDERMIFSEVHECRYQGEMLATIEYIISYEPESAISEDAGDTTPEPVISELPIACAAPHLTEARARRILGADQVSASAANEHIPALRSQCIYSARGGAPRQVGYVYRFMLSDLFDIDRLAPQQVQFNATFASGGAALQQTMDEPGSRAFVFLEGDRTTLFVITGIEGRADPTGRDQEFIANYYLERADMSHEERMGVLVDLAEMDLRAWREPAD